MQDLQQLVKLIERKGRLSGSHLINFSDENSLETKLYFYLKNNQETDEAAILNHLYEDESKRDAFKMLKSRFRRKLFNQLNFLELSSKGNKTNLIQIEAACNKLLSETSILVKLGAELLAEKQILRALKMAQDTQLTKCTIEALEQYASLTVSNHDQKNIQRLEAELQEQYKILDLEREANHLYRISVSAYRAGVQSRELYLGQLKGNVERLQVLWEKSGNSQVFHRYHFLNMLYLEQTGNFESQTKFIKNAQRLYIEGLIHPLYYVKEYNAYVLVYTLLRSGKLEEGLIEAKKLNESLTKGVHNWFVHNENYFMLAIYIKDYGRAGAILSDVLQHENFKNQKSPAQERWVLYAEIYKLITSIQLNINLSIDLLNITSDKKGFNVWLLILDFLTNLKEGRHEKLYREAERIRKYMSKYLNSKADPRYRLFLKLLLLVVKEEFDGGSIKLKSRYLVKKLEQTPPAGDAYAEIEIVPFEHLWEFILRNLAITKVKA